MTNTYLKLYVCKYCHRLGAFYEHGDITNDIEDFCKHLICETSGDDYNGTDTIVSATLFDKRHLIYDSDEGNL